MRPLPTALAVLLLGVALPAAAHEFKVVVHLDNPASEVTEAQLSRLFLKRTLNWDDGAPVQPVEPSTTHLRERFARAIHRKSLNAVKSYWNQMIFSGRDVPPLERPGDPEVLAYVRANRGAIGYVGPGADTGGVKILTIKP